MEKTKESKKILRRFIIKLISLEIIIGVIAFVLENLIPEVMHWEFTANLIIYQSVIFVISTLLITIFAAAMSIKNTEFDTKEEAEKVIKPINKILIVIAVIIMIFNILYYFGIQKSGHKDVEAKYEIGEGMYEIDKENKIEKEKDEIDSVSKIYVVTKEIIIVLTYAYASSYIEKMIEINTKKESKKEIKEEPENK